jgi:hypothetical protein
MSITSFLIHNHEGPSWWCSYDSWIYNYLCNQCLSPLPRGIDSRFRVRVIVFNDTFNNISVILWRSVLFGEETGGPGEKHRSVTNHWQTLSRNVVHPPLSPLMWVRISIRARCTTLRDKVCQWLVTDQWFSPGTPVSYTNKTDRHL